MRKGGFSQEQIIGILREQEATHIHTWYVSTYCTLRRLRRADLCVAHPRCLDQAMRIGWPNGAIELTLHGP